mmetsp:Transcript_82271/g.166720  ORF Transcript_82271/g.166720 Transcript_82271/m.166720 type:complete len:127 (-) Transcript_82271:749-1129(-)
MAFQDPPAVAFGVTARFISFAVVRESSLLLTQPALLLPSSLVLPLIVVLVSTRVIAARSGPGKSAVTDGPTERRRDTLFVPGNSYTLYFPVTTVDASVAVYLGRRGRNSLVSNILLEARNGAVDVP